MNASHWVIKLRNAFKLIKTICYIFYDIMCSLGDCWFDECVICMMSGKQTVAFRHRITTILCHYALIKSLTPTAQMHSTSFSLSFLSLSASLPLTLARFPLLVFYRHSLLLVTRGEWCNWQHVWWATDGGLKGFSSEWVNVCASIQEAHRNGQVKQKKQPIGRT